MNGRYKQSEVSGLTRFTKSPMSEVEYSRLNPMPSLLTTMNAGDIVPIYCEEILPHSSRALSLDFVIRQTTSLAPVMGSMMVDYYAFFVPNRIVNESWVNVQGENTSGTWTAPEVSLVPLMRVGADAPSSVQVPVGSVADYYGFPTQGALSSALLARCHDLKFRGYLEIYNNYFRDQNYQPPIPYSKLNLYNGFFEPAGSSIPLNPYGVRSDSSVNFYPQNSDGSVVSGAISKAIYGEGVNSVDSIAGTVPPRLSSWSALSRPLKANKYHDYFTSVLPSPQKGREVMFALGDTVPLVTGEGYSLDNSIRLDNSATLGQGLPKLVGVGLGSGLSVYRDLSTSGIAGAASPADYINLYADLEKATALTVSDLRLSAALQQTYEVLARGGSRYRELLASFFELDTDDTFPSIPRQLGHFRRELDLYQTAQTSASVDGSTPQGNLTAFGYTNNGGFLFNETFIEHGYVHVFAVIRHKNLYSYGISRDNFRLNTLDFYLPTLANISEQPVPTYELNAFGDIEGVIGYQEAWAEYRYEPDRATGYMRSGIDGSLNVWNFADDYDPTFESVNGNWLVSNSEEVLARSLAIRDEPQFKCQFIFKVDKQLPMPTFSVPGMDII